MLVKDIMTKSLVTCEPDETISQALAKMKTKKIHQLPVLKGKELEGILVLNNIIKREFDPSTTKVSSLMISCPTTRSSATIEEVAELIIDSNLRAIPVVDKELVGIISESDLMRVIKVDANLDEVAKECIFVSDKDNIGKAKRLIVYKNISRVPIVKDGKFYGIIGTLDLIKILEPGKRIRESRGFGLRDRGYKEKINIDETPVTAIMRKPIVIKRDVKIENVISLLKDNEEVLIENGILGIITPKDILRLLIKPKRKTYVQITGLEDESSVEIAKIHKTIEETLKRIALVSEIQPMSVYVEHHRKLGKTKFSIRAKLPTQIGTFVVSRVWGWNLFTVIQEAMNNLERKFWKTYDKIKGHERAKKRLSRGK